MTEDTFGGEWKWQVIFEHGENEYKKVGVKRLVVNVPSFSGEYDMLIIGGKYHMACYGVVKLQEGVGPRSTQWSSTLVKGASCALS